MKAIFARVCATIVVAAVAVAGVPTAQASASRAANLMTIGQPFNVDAGDNCGFTAGQLDWLVEPGATADPNVVKVSAYVVDRSVPGDGAEHCRDDRLTVATFTAEPGPGATPATVTQQVDNNAGFFPFSLQASPGVQIERVLIQVCRISPDGSQTYCGTPRAHARPPIEP